VGWRGEDGYDKGLLDLDRAIGWSHAPPPHTASSYPTTPTEKELYDKRLDNKIEQAKGVKLKGGIYWINGPRT
jgi:hypothetical protein